MRGTLACNNSLSPLLAIIHLSFGHLHAIGLKKLDTSKDVTLLWALLALQKFLSVELARKLSRPLSNFGLWRLSLQVS